MVDNRLTREREWTFGALEARLAAEPEASRRLAAEVLARVRAPDGEGAHVFIGGPSAAVIRQAEDAGVVAVNQGAPLAGLPVSIKDNIDQAGLVTGAGTPALCDRAPAQRDATVARRLLAAGALIVGRTNMSELAFSGVGLNPHFGTPLNPFDRAAGRIPGGSSSGAAVSVSDRMAVAAVGTDTGGSVRIPAALCGLVGFKPTPSRVPRDGVLPLCAWLDAVGTIATCVEDCLRLDVVLSGELGHYSRPLSSLRLLVLDSVFRDDCEPPVAAAFETTLRRIEAAGAWVARHPALELRRVHDINSRGSFVSAEAWSRYGALIASHRARMDPRIVERLEAGRNVSPANLAANRRDLLALRAVFSSWMADFDAVLAPTSPVVAPPLAALAAPDDFARFNRLLLRNPSVANLLERPSITLPCHEPGAAPVGLMLIGKPFEDRALLAAARALEAVLAQ